MGRILILSGWRACRKGHVFEWLGYGFANLAFQEAGLMVPIQSRDVPAKSAQMS
jgi:hypothetical protein